MNIFDYDLTTAAEEGFTLTLRDPISGEKTDAEITVIGSDSKTYRRAKAEAMRKVAKSQDSDPDEVSADVYAACVKGWDNLTDDKGKPIPFSQEKSRELLVKFPWLMDQIGMAVDSRANFMKPVEKS